MSYEMSIERLMTEKQILKIVILSLVFVIVILTGTLARLYLRPPLIIEKSCDTKIYQSVISPEHDEPEVKNFIELVLPQRFNSNMKIDGNYFFESEILQSEHEKTELNSRQLNQVIVIDEVKIMKDQITVKLDRLIRMGTIRTVLPLNVSLKLQSVDRSIQNPYGLKIQSIKSIEEKK